MLVPLILTVAMFGQTGSWYSTWWYYPMPPEVRPHIIEIRSGFAAEVIRMEYNKNMILARLNDGEVVYLAYGPHTAFSGYPQPGDRLWVDKFRNTITVGEPPPLILEERR